MSCPGLMVGLLVLGQVPPPTLGTDAARELEAARRSIVASEAAQLKGLAEQLASRGDKRGRRRVRERIPRPARPDGPTRFMPLPEVVAGSSRGQGQ